MELQKLILTISITTLLIIFILFIAFFQLPTTFFLFAAILFALILSLTLFLLLHYRSKSTHQPLNNDHLRLNYSFLRRVAGLPKTFTYKQLALATDNFTAMLGHGSSGAVFKGILDDGTPVAVKMIEAADYGEKEFKAEISAIAGVQHVNLIRLLGYCTIATGPYYLVYEFVENGSLDTWIFARKPKGNDRIKCLPWYLRFRVGVDVAKALAYLHHDCRLKVLHLDIKPENILLDESFRAVVADFGLSKLVGREESRVMATMRGTKGYLAPEWVLEYGISEKSDVYSFGMVLLEMVGGRRNVEVVKGDGFSERKWSYFPKIVGEKVRRGEVMEVVDERLMRGGEVIDVEEVRIVVNVALWCIQERPELRPSMGKVVDMLQGRVKVDVRPETEMVVVDLLSIDEDGDSSVGDGRKSKEGESVGDLSEDRQTASSPSGYSFAMSTISAR